MKHIYKPFLLALAITACQEGNITPEVAVVSDEMSFNILAPGLQTKVANNAFEASDVIGLYVTDYVNETTPMPLQISGNHVNNMTLTFDDGAWTPEQTIYWGKGKSDIYAYYPYISEMQDVESQYFEVSSDQTKEGYEASDLLWAKAEGVKQTDGAVSLQMQHVMSKLTVKIVAGEEYIGSLPDDASVLLHSTVTGARVNLSTGSVSKDPYSGAKSIKMKKLGVRTYEGVEAVVYEAIVVPQMIEGSVPLIEINSKSVSYLLEDPFNFRPGVAYTYTATLNTSTTAIKVEIGCELEDWNSTGGSGSGDGEEGGEDSGEDGKSYTDLSAAGTANCYLVQGAGDYKFKSVIGNTDATVGNVKSVEVLWESFGTDEMPNVGDLIASVSYKNGYIRFSTPENFRDGNAVIAAKNSKGTILWSWHIWCAEEGFNGQVYYNDAGTMMDRNLGATSATPGNVGALGLMYQWGRKDPFMGSSSVSSGGIAVSTGTWNITNEGSAPETDTNPTTFYINMILPKGSWSSMKTVYDPCPAGWRVPEGGENGVWAKALGTSSSVSLSYDNTNFGINLTGIYGDAESIWYPEAGYLNSSNGALYIKTEIDGTMHIPYAAYCYWSCSRVENRDYSFYLRPDNIDMSYNRYCADACPVRCLKDEDEIGPGDVEMVEDLSTNGSANCYIVSKAGTFKFTPTKGNSSESVGSVASAEVLWETFGTDVAPAVGDLVKSASYKNGEITFQTADTYKEGNAVIAAKDASGNILWSWHIWLTDEPQGQVYYNNAGTMMDRNLGATSATPGDVGALGLLYQWGRKDPFLGSSNISSPTLAKSTITWPFCAYSDSSKGTIEYATAHPTTFITNTHNRSNHDWYYTGSSLTDNTRWTEPSSEKSIYDPCPSGWRVPDNDVWSNALGSSSISYYGEYDGTNEGMNFSGMFGDDSTIWYPASGYLLDGSGNLENVGIYTFGLYWSASPSGSQASNLYFYDYGEIQPGHSNYRAYGYSVRCLKE